jgi:hypothetical protein
VRPDLLCLLEGLTGHADGLDASEKGKIQK